jgi:arabinogalactan oligomer/maltooligosaccharide transport system permease protein
VTTGALGITAAKGYTIVKGNELFSLDQQLRDYVVPVGASSGIRPQGISQAVELEPTLRWEPKRGAFVRISDGAVFRDNGKGAFVSASGEELEPGWRTYVGGTNFSRIWNDPQVRKPFLRVFVWTFVFAISTVFFSFAIGLFLAIALNKKGMRMLRLYRSIIVIPWAVPGFLSLLVWQGLLNDDFGVVNRIFHLSVPWLFDANWAKVSCILVSVWLTVPYFFLVSTLPLLMVAVSPLLIASFAFNFNNFNNIYLLTSGGPPMADASQSIAGSTDILISYTYKLAIQTGKGQDFGLAAAFTIVIFLIVASISAVSFSRTKALENIN